MKERSEEIMQNNCIRVRVVLQVGYVDDADQEHITGEIDSAESFWAGGDFTNAAAVALFDKLKSYVEATNPQ